MHEATSSIPRAALLLSALPFATAAAQDLCQGKGAGGAYIEIGPAYIGGKFVHDMGSPNVPNGFCFFAVSDGFELTSTALLGTVCMDITSPAFVLFALPTDPTGNVHVEFPLPPSPLLASFPTFHSNVVTFEGGAWSVSKTTALFFQNADAWAPTKPMSTPRFHHTATALYADGRDNESRIFVAGGSASGTPTVPGALAATEIFHPLDRSFTPGPYMSIPRTAHTATRLADGRVLIAGGMDAAGVCHRTCEVFDPATGTLSPTGDMTTERASHTATLLGDGRVLVTGGLRDYQNPSTAFVAALDTAQASAELYDPATGTWTSTVLPMSEKRAGQSATLLPDGRVLIAGGIRGGFFAQPWDNQVPSFTSTADFFDPATDQFTPAAPLSAGRAYHGASLLPGGQVLVTGGLATLGIYGEAGALSTCALWNGATWSGAPPLAAPAAWPAQATLPSGEALVVGGLHLTTIASSTILEATALAGGHDGTVFTGLTEIGLNPGLPGSKASPRGAMTITRMYDGTYLVLGGYGDFSEPGNGALGMVYTPEP